ncbi:hypothetical protein OA77_19450, partial [Pseudomonas coronafaciens]
MTQHDGFVAVRAGRDDIDRGGEVAREREFETDQQNVTMSLNSVQSVDFTLEGYTPQRDLNRATLGVSQKLT